MEPNKLLPPAARCTNCGHTSLDMGRIGQQCGQRFDGKRCKGVNGSALNTADWEECPTCLATGREGDSRCTQCGGEGWRYVRDMPRRR